MVVTETNGVDEYSENVRRINLTPASGGCICQEMMAKVFNAAVTYTCPTHGMVTVDRRAPGATNLYAWPPNASPFNAPVFPGTLPQAPVYPVYPWGRTSTLPNQSVTTATPGPQTVRLTP